MSTITEMNKFMMKNVVKKMKTMKIREIARFLSFYGTMSLPFASIALYITPGHISKVETSKNVTILTNTWL